MPWWWDQVAVPVLDVVNFFLVGAAALFVFWLAVVAPGLFAFDQIRQSVRSRRAQAVYLREFRERIAAEKPEEPTAPLLAP